MRALQVPFQTKLHANSVSADFLIATTNGPKGDAVLSSVPVLTGLKYPQSFPDAAPARVIRKAVFSCSIYSKNCTLV
jgi:hypothetical protein